ncbi:hypothetical protein ACLOJK_010347 [Asimina triloba]
MSINEEPICHRLSYSPPIALDSLSLISAVIASRQSSCPVGREGGRNGFPSRSICSESYKDLLPARLRIPLSTSLSRARQKLHQWQTSRSRLAELDGGQNTRLASLHDLAFLPISALPDVAFFFPDRHPARFGSSPPTFSLAIDETFINGRPPDLGLLNSTTPKTLVWQHFPISASYLPLDLGLLPSSHGSSRTVNRRPSISDLYFLPNGWSVFCMRILTPIIPWFIGNQEYLDKLINGGFPLPRSHQKDCHILFLNLWQKPWYLPFVTFCSFQMAGTLPSLMAFLVHGCDRWLVLTVEAYKHIGLTLKKHVWVWSELQGCFVFEVDADFCKVASSLKYKRISARLLRSMSASAVGSGEGDHSEQLQTTGMLSRRQLIHLFNRFSQLTSQPDVKKRIADAVKDKQEAVAATTAIQEEILLEMGIDPSFGIACLGKVNVVYENDRDLMIRFCGFFAKEELACDEAELEPEEFTEKMHAQQVLQGQQLEMLKHM